MSKIELSMVVNGRAVTAWVEPHHMLLDVLRGELDLLGTKEGCGKGECGACTVLVDEEPLNACLFPALEAEGRRITTIEGLTLDGGELGPMQAAFVDQGGIQCGFCSPGMILNAHALLRKEPDPSDAEIRHALIGNLCRCTGYEQIIRSVREAARRARG